MPSRVEEIARKSFSSSAKRGDDFGRLVKDLSDALGPSSGLDSVDINPRDLEKVMEAYISAETDWAEFAWADYSRSYTRNLVDEGNGKSNLVCCSRSGPRYYAYNFQSLCWSGPRGRGVQFMIIPILIA